VTSDERWLAANWPFVRGSLPAAPAQVVEIGCGPLGGFVPMMEAVGYQATGVDPEAPPGPSYRQVEFERYGTAGQLDAIVACTSLHHVADLAGVLDLVTGVLVPGGQAVIVEWARERFDEATARWCFARLPGPDDDPGWLHQRQAEWHESGQPWDACLRSWVHAEGCTPDRTSWKSWMPASTVGLSPIGRTSSPTWRAPATPTSRLPSTAG
jgi:SAM-dependent methyltransferase